MLKHLLDRRGDRIWFLRAAPNASGFQEDTLAIEGVVLVRVEGELDMASASRFERVLNDALENHAPTVALDLSELTFIGSTGIHVLISAYRRAADQGCTFVLRSPTRSVLKVLCLTGVDRLMVIEPSP